MRALVLLLAAAALIVVAGCGGDEADTTKSKSVATETSTTTKSKSVATQPGNATYCKTSCDEGDVRPPIPKEISPKTVGLHRCHPGPEGGGYRVWIRNVSCDDIQRVLPFLSSLRVGAAKNPEGRVGVFRNVEAWSCWAEYRARLGVIRNICFRGDQLVFFDRA